jgi:hypothetical protein
MQLAHLLPFATRLAAVLSGALVVPLGPRKCRVYLEIEGAEAEALIAAARASGRTLLVPDADAPASPHPLTRAS